VKHTPRTAHTRRNVALVSCQVQGGSHKDTHTHYSVQPRPRNAHTHRNVALVSCQVQGASPKGVATRTHTHTTLFNPHLTPHTHTKKLHWSAARCKGIATRTHTIQCSTHTQKRAHALKRCLKQLPGARGKPQGGSHKDTHTLHYSTHT